MKDTRGAALLGTIGGLEVPGDEAPAGEPPDPGALVAGWMADEDALVLLGELDQVPLALAVGQVRRRGRPLGQLRCCFVEPEGRGIGLGSSLIAALVAWFVDQGCRDVDALALPGDRLTKQVLEGAGFKARLLVLHRPLD